MSEKKRFQNQTLNSDDYKKTEEGAGKIKVSMIVTGTIAVTGALIKEYGPKIVKGVRSFFKS